MFTPVHTTLGALLLFSGSFGLLLHNGRVFGISSILRACLQDPALLLRRQKQKEKQPNGPVDVNEDQNFPMLAGLITSPLLVKLVAPSLLPSYPEPGSTTTLWISAAATVGWGFLTGWGTKNDQGCTSGHMLCGLSRLSARSLIATAIFFTTALVTANFSPLLTGVDLIPACNNGATPCYLPVYPSGFELVVMTTSCISSLFTTFVLGPKILTRSSKSRRVFAYLAGLQFGLGLLFSGMADPKKVIRFFALFGGDVDKFDPSLALIILFGIGPSLYGYLAAKPGKAEKLPTLAHKWSLPKLTVADIDWRFIVGAVVFGVAWGSSGVCPGPAILRSVLQPVWGVLWMSGYFLGGIV
ncbi:YeeE/YedE family integral membrane protein [Talaromyces stipitatus ATCC 10500]|uniref:YeeE/YedE family integral membrane protein n=1 Tax=Talaromyces stipitatus (strain ATCC 10500 / CBS 375.48 / QM 6759 / NRRL 1006) TaxID=441959 RepID=B8M895_TALSN|nr:YeeE/YedE family integral membrane protein [Talaromyces stipitatus ATCC 10500]EED20408.1 YeeE/YedE family integral membrane protein [Talaromyces stipitatus ATCC 10500]